MEQSSDSNSMTTEPITATKPTTATEPIPAPESNMAAESTNTSELAQEGPKDKPNEDTIPPVSRLEDRENRRSSRHRRSKPNAGFVITDRIGKGSFATVYKGKWNGDQVSPDSDTWHTVAIKVVQRSHLRKEKRLMGIFEAEMAILKKMTHPHVVHLIDVVKTSSDFNLIMEYCAMGDLSNFIRKKHHLIRHSADIAELYRQYPSNHSGLHPHLVRHFLAQLACSLAFLREHNIVHRDVKPQNLLLKPGAGSPEEAHRLGYAGSWDLPVVKIADFGFARFLPSTSMAETLCGSPLYMAPEILNYEKYNAKADLWSVGAVTYEMATGKPPFPAANHLELIRKIDNSKDQIHFPFPVAEDLQDIIRGLLKRQPDDRLSFDDFFRRTAWSENVVSSDSADTSATKSKDTQLEAVGSNSDAPKSDAAKSQPSLASSSSSSADHGSDITSYSQYLRRQGDNVAVASPSPSPESSQSGASSTVRRSQHSETLNRAGGSRAGDGRSGDSENEYVFIEKQAVEVNSLADELQAPPGVPRRRLTNPEKGTGRRRLSSIAYGASPTNALAQALLKSSARLFGARADSTSSLSTSGSKASSLFGANPAGMLPTGEKQVVDELEQLATIAKVVSLYAEVKHVQLDTGEPSPEPSSLRPSPSPASHDEADIPAPIDPYFQMTLAEEALVLHLKALSVLARAMTRASDWWEHRQGGAGTTAPTPGINSLVQWIRDKFNECVAQAEIERNIVKRLAAETQSTMPTASAERLLFDRALEMAKAAAVQEMAASESTSSFSEAAATCEMNYGTAVWMLRSLLVTENNSEALSEDDQTMVETLLAKIAQRLASLRRKLAVSSQMSHSDRRRSSGSSGSQKSLNLGHRSSFSQLTPP